MPLRTPLATPPPALPQSVSICFVERTSWSTGSSKAVIDILSPYAWLHVVPISGRRTLVPRRCAALCRPPSDPHLPSFFLRHASPSSSRAKATLQFELARSVLNSCARAGSAPTDRRATDAARLACSTLPPRLQPDRPSCLLTRAQGCLGSASCHLRARLYLGASSVSLWLFAYPSLCESPRAELFRCSVGELRRLSERL